MVEGRGGYAQSSSRRAGSNEHPHFYSQNHSIYIHIPSVFFFVSIIDDNSSLWWFFFITTNVETLSNENLKIFFWCRWWSSANHHHRLSSERGSRVPLTVTFRWHLTRHIKKLILCTYLHIHMHVGVSVLFIYFN